MLRAAPLAILALLACLPSLRAGETVCPVMADNSIACDPSEMTENTGHSKTIKIKGRENLAIFKFDLSGIPADAVVEKAVLNVGLSTPAHRIRQIGYTTVPTDWVEGSGKADAGDSCCRWPAQGKKWGDSNSKIMDVIFGNGGNVSGCVLAREVSGRYDIDLPGRVIEAMRRDQPGGLLLVDESGWWNAELSNIYILSRESGKGPTLKVTWGAKPAGTPATPAIAVVPAALPDGQMLVEITCAAGSVGPALGFDLCTLADKAVTAANWSEAAPLPRYRTPRPKGAGEKIRLLLIGLEPGKPYAVGIAAYDANGARSAVASTPLSPATGPQAEPTFGAAPAAPAKGSPVKVADVMQLWAVDELTAVDPASGKVLGAKGYADTAARDGNHVWNGAAQTVQLSAVRGEIVAFRLAVETLNNKALHKIAILPGDLKSDAGAVLPAEKNVLLRRDWYFPSGSAWYPNAIPELQGKDGGLLDIPAADQSIPNQILQTVMVEILVPKTLAAGTYSGRITVRSDAGTGELPVRLQVADAVMPDTLSFIIELNSYGVENKEYAYAVHRLAHRFRLGYNVCPYGHTGKTSVPFVPKITGTGKDAKVASWETWDAWMGPLLDGSLFQDLPRGATPIPQCYLPFYENYPAPVDPGYANGRVHRKGYEATGKTFDKGEYNTWMCANDVLVEDGFSDDWKQAAAAVAAEYRRHFEEKGWTGTQFQIFANNKHFKGEYPTSLWTLDEPSFGRDFRALGFLYRTFQQPFAGSRLNVITRGDVSRPEWQGDRLDGACDLFVVSSAIYSYQAQLRRRMAEHGSRYWFYGGAPAPDRDMSQLTAVYLKNWMAGCEGGLAYWTSFGGNKWDEPSDLACVLMGSHGYGGKAVPTMRISASRRAQQDIELLNLLSRKPGWDRVRVTRALGAALNFASSTQAKNADDPGVITFGSINAESLATVRTAVIRLLGEK
jgi:hypothetical protein